MTWNYRVTREVIDGDEHFALREVYYEGDVPASWTAEPVGFEGDSRVEIVASLERALHDARHLGTLHLDETPVS